MRQLKSCGVIVFRRRPELAFLLMQHEDRLDLPKGHMKEGESEVTCALRELAEETGLPQGAVRLEEGFRFSTTYYPRYRRFGNEVVEKTVVIFLGWLEGEHPVQVSEHAGFRWVPWRPPHAIQARTVDPLLAEVERFLAPAGAPEGGGGA